MSDDPIYVELGDEFETNEWRYPDGASEEDILRVTGRKYFQTEAQAKSVRAIFRLTKKFPSAYVLELMEWARERNKSRTIITLPKLIRAIRNPDNRAMFLSTEPETEERDGYGQTDYSW